MSEFKKSRWWQSWSTRAIHSSGFEVSFGPNFTVKYRDASGKLALLPCDPRNAIVELYKEPGLRWDDGSLIANLDEVFANAERGLRFLGVNVVTQ